MQTRTTITMTFGVASLLISSCGADDDPLTKAEFLEQANAICHQSNEELEPIFEQIYADLDAGHPESGGAVFERWDHAMEQVRPIVDEQLDDIRALGFPTGDREFLETLLGDQEREFDRFATMVDEAAAGSAAAREAMSVEEDPFADIDRRAREYGLTVCGESEG